MTPSPSPKSCLTPYSLAFALGCCPAPSVPSGGARAQERAEAAITLSTEQGFPLWLVQGAMSKAGPG